MSGGIPPLSPKATDFLTALRALCRAHKVGLAVAGQAALQIWDSWAPPASSTHDPLLTSAIEDRTSPVVRWSRPGGGHTMSTHTLHAQLAVPQDLVYRAESPRVLWEVLQGQGLIPGGTDMGRVTRDPASFAIVFEYVVTFEEPA